MKKRILALALALVLMLCATIPAIAAEVTTETTQGATLTYEVGQSFTVTIPETVTISGTERKGTGEIIVAGSVIPFGKSLTVTITGATNYDEISKFRLKDGANANYIEYDIKIGTNPVEKGTAFLTVAAGTATGSAELTYTAASPTIAGEYTDSLTFTVAVVPKP